MLCVAFSGIARSIAATTHASLPWPCAFSTFRLMIFAAGATPLIKRFEYVPDEDAPLPAIIPATCVPCPNWSFVVPLPVKSSLYAIRPDRSVTAFTPLSITATPTPEPV